MEPLELALKYMDVVFSGKNIDDLSQLITPDFVFYGPFYRFDSARDYISALKADPPEGFFYSIIKSFSDESTVGLFYEFTKGDVSTSMAQLFRMRDDRISEVTVIFDTGVVFP